MLESRPEDASKTVSAVETLETVEIFVGQKTLHYNHQIHQNNLLHLQYSDH